MSVTKLNPYLHFDGTADQAIALYQRALGATTSGPIMRYGDVDGPTLAPEHKNRVMHAELRIGGGAVMVSDTQPGQAALATAAVAIALHFSDLHDMERKFDALAAGGKVTIPLGNTFWGARFGMLTDAFGVRWMFNGELKKS
jgi:PhnB protein